MTREHRRPLGLAAAVLTVGLLGAACGSPNKSSEGTIAETTTTTVARGPETTASQLRARLAGLFGEHVYLAAAAADAAGDGRGDEATAATAALEENSEAITSNIGAVFGDETGDKFGAAWRKFVGGILGGGDTATQELATVLNAAMPALPVDALAGALNSHAAQLKAAVDAHKGGNDGKAYTDLRTAAANSSTLVSTLMGGITKAQPDKVGGDPASKGADVLSSLTVTLREHVFLAAAATDAALAGRTGEFTAAAAALDANSDALVGAVGSVYGAEGEKAFSPLWKKHITFLVDYANALRDKNQAKADETMQSLLTYTQDFGAFINAASPKLTREAVAELVKTHVLTLKDVIDAQAAKNWSDAFGRLRTAADHMSMMATTLATTIVAQFPQNF